MRLAAFAVGAVRPPHPASDNPIIQRLARKTPDHPYITPEPPDEPVSACLQTVDRSHGVKYYEITGRRPGASRDPNWISCDRAEITLRPRERTHAVTTLVGSLDLEIVRPGGQGLLDTRAEVQRRRVDVVVGIDGGSKLV